MKTTMNIQDDLLKEAMEATGIKEKTALVHLGLQELVKKARYKRLIALGGTDPQAKATRRASKASKTSKAPRRKVSRGNSR